MTDVLTDLPVVQGLSLTVDGSVLTVELDAPDGNLMTMAMCDALAQVLREPPAGVHVLVLRAAGERFCLGRERTAATPDDLPVEVGRLVAVNEALASTPLVTVARVHGDAGGFGVGIAALCDVAIATSAAKLFFPEVRIDLVRHQVTVRDAPVNLTRSEFQVLRLLADNPGQVFSRLQIMEELWQQEFSGDVRACDVHISNLRQKVERDPQDPELVLTVRGVGYRLADGR